MKLKLTTMLAVVMIIAACTKTQTKEADIQNVSGAKIANAIATADFQSRIHVFDLLSEQERYVLWRDHLVKAKEQFINEKNEAGVNSISELLANLTPEVFDVSSKASAIFSNYFMPNWVASSRSVFTPAEMYDIGFDPSVKIIGRTAPEDIGGGPGGANCFCHVGTSGFSCRKIEVGFPSGVSIVNGICERTGACTGSSTGCGWLWLQSCSGDHCNF
jgi:hypothetical protein